MIPEVEVLIDQAWREASKRPGIHLFDGPMCRLESFDARESSLQLALSRTSYKPFMGTNLNNPRLADKYGLEILANPVGLSALLMSSDGFAMLGRRNEHVAYYPGHVHPFSGALEPHDPLDVFDEIRRELSEELSLYDADIEQIVCTGFAMDMSIRQPEMIFFARAAQTKARIESQLNTEEHRGIWTCAATREGLERGLASDEKFTPVGVAALLMWGRIEFGHEWFESNIPQGV
jgi:hypothetical protein